jgi:uncharacterized protein YggE
MKLRLATNILFVATLVFSTRAQDIQVNRENKTVAVSVTRSVEVPPDYAWVQLGYRNRGPEQAAVYEENGRHAEKIISALLAAGVKKSDIQTQSLDLARVDESSQDQDKEKSKEPVFEAAQTWTVRAPIGSVQNVVDQAVAAGANAVNDVQWAVADPDALDARARGAAMDNARRVADEMAKSLGGKAGGLLYVSNSEPNGSYYRNGGGFGKAKLLTVEVAGTRLPILNLFPQNVRREVTIYAVFALE